MSDLPPVTNEEEAREAVRCVLANVSTLAAADSVEEFEATLSHIVGVLQALEKFMGP